MYRESITIQKEYIHIRKFVTQKEEIVMTAVMSSYQIASLGDFLIVVAFIVATFFVQAKESGLLEQIMESICIYKRHIKRNRNVDKKLRRKAHSMYLREKKSWKRREQKRVKNQLYHLWNSYVEAEFLPLIELSDTEIEKERT